MKLKRTFAILILTGILIAVIGSPKLRQNIAAITNEVLNTNSDDSIFGNVLRMHIIANSNSELDQEVKLAVRDALLKYEIENTDAADAENAVEAEAILAEHGDGLLSAARDVLNDYGVDYDAELVFGKFDFPERKYGDILYPAGEYRAVRVLLGEAEGKNWWCVMFPPLCIVEARDGEIEYEEPIRFDSFFVRLWEYLKTSIFGSKVEIN